HKPSGIIPEPAEVEMEPAGIEAAGWRRSQPHLKIHPLRRIGIRHHRPRLHPALVTPDLHRTYIAQYTGLHIIHRILEMLLAPLPLPSLDHPAVSLLGSHHGFVFSC